MSSFPVDVYASDEAPVPGEPLERFQARLVTGNFFKRFCTIGWALTALIVLALMADDP